MNAQALFWQAAVIVSIGVGGLCCLIVLAGVVFLVISYLIDRDHPK